MDMKGEDKNNVSHNKMKIYYLLSMRERGKTPETSKLFFPHASQEWQVVLMLKKALNQPQKNMFIPIKTVYIIKVKESLSDTM